MKNVKVGRNLLALWVGAGILVMGADWLSRRGDPEQTGWQRKETVLTVRNVKGLHLLWKQQFPAATAGLTDPLLLGPIITHRGIKELVFVKDGSDTVHAVDADLGRIFWSRSLRKSKSDTSTLKASCEENTRLMPAMAPDETKAESTDGDDDYSNGNRPLYVLSADNRLYALRASTGDDFSGTIQFPAFEGKPVGFGIVERSLYVTTSPVCDGVPDRVWAFELNLAGAPVRSDSQARPLPKGTGSAKSPYAVFSWNGNDLVAVLQGDSSPLLQKVTDAYRQPVQSTMRSSFEGGGIATWQDADGKRWIDTTSAEGVKAFQVTGSKDRPELSPLWSSSKAAAAGPPVLADGILYYLSRTVLGNSNRLALHALNAQNGEDLYSSGELVTSDSASGNIALANGHMCFSANDNTLYCFGLPVEL